MDVLSHALWAGSAAELLRRRGRFTAGEVAGAWRWHRPLLHALLGWWLHLALDIPTHSREYYAVTVLYPFSEWSFDGVAWPTPWLLGVDWVLLVAAWAALAFTSRRRSR